MRTTQEIREEVGRAIKEEFGPILFTGKPEHDKHVERRFSDMLDNIAGFITAEVDTRSSLSAMMGATGLLERCMTMPGFEEDCSEYRKYLEDLLIKSSKKAESSLEHVSTVIGVSMEMTDLIGRSIASIGFFLNEEALEKDNLIKKDVLFALVEIFTGQLEDSMQTKHQHLEKSNSILQELFSIVSSMRKSKEDGNA